MLDIKFHHVGIGAGDRGAQLAALINSPHQKNLSISRMVDEIEFMFDTPSGSLHHLCLSTKSIERAIFFLENKVILLICKLLVTTIKIKSNLSILMN